MVAISHSAVSVPQVSWRMPLMLTLGFWLSASLVLDLVIMPILFTSGMMAETGFATAGYTLFWVFNRLELLCAALVLTAVLFCWGLRSSPGLFRQSQFFLAVLLFAVAAIDTYLLTPQMSSLGLQLNLFAPLAATPDLMNQFHAAYWVLDGVKLLAGGLLLGQCWRSSAVPG